MSGTYVEFPLLSGSESNLRLWITADLGLEEPKYPSHSTTVYSRGRKIDYEKRNLPREAYMAHSSQHSILLLNKREDKVDLVLGVNCNVLYYSHQYAVNLGAEWDYPSFIPHVTIAYGIEIKKLIGLPLRPPYFNLEFGPEMVFDIGEDRKVQRKEIES